MIHLMPFFKILNQFFCEHEKKVEAISLAT